jgi:hypothetical protein
MSFTSDYKPFFDKKKGKWRIDFPHPFKRGPDGKKERVQHAFKSKVKADRKAQEYGDEFGAGIVLSENEKKDAEEALAVLESSTAELPEKSLVAAARFFADHFPRYQSSLSVKAAVELYLEKKKDHYGEAADAYQNPKFFLNQLLESDLANRKVIEITADDHLQPYLDSFEKSYPHRRRYLIEFFNFLCGKGRAIKFAEAPLTKNPATDTNTPPKKGVGELQKEKQILTAK